MIHDEQEGICKDFEDMIDAYVAGRLPKDQRIVLEQHLRDCPKCREEVAATEVLASLVIDQEKKGKGYHLDSATIVDYATQPDRMDPLQRNAALEHLRTCKRCQDELELLRNVASDLGMEPVAESAAESAVEPALTATTAPAVRTMGALGSLRAWLSRPVPQVRWMAVSAVILAAALAASLPTFMSLRKARSEMAALGASLEQRTAEAQRAADSLSSQIVRLQEEVTIARAAIPPTAPPSETPRYPSQETLARVLRETDALPKVFDIGEGVQLTSSGELRSVLSAPAKIVVPDRAGDEIHLVMDRPELLSGRKTADIQLFKIEGDSISPAQKWQNVPLASTTGKVLLPIPQGVMEPGDYILTIMPPKLQFRSGLRSPAPEKSASFHLSVQPKNPGNGTPPK